MIHTTPASLAAVALLIAGSHSPPVATPSVPATEVVAPSMPTRELFNSIGMKMMLVPNGQFAMGSPRGARNADLDERQTAVTITRDYHIGAFEVTQAQFQMVMGRNPSQFQGTWVEGGGENRPVEQISWNDAVDFCKRLSELPEEKAAGRIYRLPTEAEWEYACRGGNAGDYAFGDRIESLGEYAWFEDNSDGRTHPVGQKKPNAWGLHDMHGNAWEWCADWYVPHAGRPLIDPAGPSQGTDRVYRGGGWSYAASYCRSANRTSTNPSFAGFEFLSIGFRVAMDVAANK